MIDVYWANSYVAENTTDPSFYDVSSFGLTPLQKEIKDVFPKGMEQYFKCPAAVQSFKNTFIVKSPANVTVDYKNYKTGLINRVSVDYPFSASLTEGFFLFTEKELHVEVTPAFYHKNEFINNTTLFGGTFDVSKWFRPIDCEFFSPDKKQVDIKRGDVIYYIRFLTQENVRLKRFNMSSDIMDVSKSCTGFKLLAKKTGLSTLYDSFTRNHMQKVLLRKIKNNLTPE